MGASAKYFRWTELGFSFHPRGLTSSNYSGSAVVPNDWRPWWGPGRPRFCWRKIRKADGCLWFLSFALPQISPSAYTLAYRCRHALRASDERGTSPVKLTNRFPQVKPPTTPTLGLQLTVSAADRRTFENRSAVLHHFAEAGTSSRPNRESSPGLVPWLLRYHF